MMPTTSMIHDDGYAKPRRGPGSEVQLPDHIFRYLAADFQRVHREAPSIPY